MEIFLVAQPLMAYVRNIIFLEFSRRVKTGFSSIKRLYKHARGYNIDPTSRKIASRFLALAVIVFDLFLMLG
jgi:hypothetical protein